MGFLGQALEGFGFVGALALGLEGFGQNWRGRSVHGWRGPREMQHDEEPDDRQQSELVIEKRRDHGIAPSKAW